MHLLSQKKHESKSFFTYANDKRIEKSLSTHPFNRSITISHPASLTFAIPQTAPYYRGSILLSRLLEEQALQAIAGGSITGFSTSHVDTQDCICIHGGILSLSLTKETYQRAGLQGEKSALSSGKYNAVIDFTTENFVNNKLFHRLKHSFETVFTEPFEIMVTMSTVDGQDEIICPITGLQAQDNVKTTFSEARTVPDWHQVLQVPDKNRNAGFDYEAFSELQEDVLTHISLLSVPSTVPSSVDPYISKYACPAPSMNTQDLTSTTITGFISAGYVQQLIKKLSSTSCPWFTVQIRGFEYTSMSWVGSEHGCLVGGENAITLLSVSTAGRDATNDDDNMMQNGKQVTRSQVMWEIVGARDEYN